MGEIADDMVEGRCCSLCGQYFTKEHGYPVICKDCVEDEEGDCGYQVAVHPTL